MNPEPKDFAGAGLTSDEGVAQDVSLVYPLASDEEVSLIAEMRKQLNGLLPAWEDVGGDIRLLRFLRGFDRDVATAVDAVRDMFG